MLVLYDFVQFKIKIIDPTFVSLTFLTNQKSKAQAARKMHNIFEFDQKGIHSLTVSKMHNSFLFYLKWKTFFWPISQYFRFTFDDMRNGRTIRNRRVSAMKVCIFKVQSTNERESRRIMTANTEQFSNRFRFINAHFGQAYE